MTAYEHDDMLYVRRFRWSRLRWQICHEIWDAYQWRTRRVWVEK